MAYRTGLTHRRTFGRPNPSQGPVSSNLIASTIQSSGAVAVDAVTTPDHRPGDEPDATTVLTNIRFDGCIFQSRPVPIPSTPLKDELQ